MFAYWLKKNEYYHRSLASFYAQSIEPGSRVLQIQCRNGYLLDAVQPSYGVGIDLDPAHIAEARATYPQYHFFVGSLAHIAVDDSFDYVILSSIMTELYDIAALFNQLRPLCHPGTRIIIDSYSSLWEPVLWLTQQLGLRRPTSFKHWVSQRDIINFLYLGEYEPVVNGRFMLLPVFIPLLSTCFNRFIAYIPGINHLCLNNYVIARLRPVAQPIENYAVSVIIPCKNERGNIREAMMRTPQMGKSTELIFVEGGSTDGTFEEIQALIQEFPEKKIRCLKQKGKHKIGAVHTGFEVAAGDILVILDADLTVVPEELPRFVEALVQQKGELINGSRLVYGMEPGAMRFIALIANWIFSHLVSFVIQQPIKDSLCGTKVLFKKDYERLQRAFKGVNITDPFGDFELLFGAAKLHLVIRDLPVHYKSRSYGKSQISHVTGGLMLLYMVLLGFRNIRSH